jgi:putative ABC transport system permease protein
MRRSLAWLETLEHDLRLAIRSLRKSPGFLAVVVLSLAVGIGANSTIFSVIDYFTLSSVAIRAPGTANRDS